MKRITAEQFKEFVKKEPAWASKLTEPLEITTFADMQGSPITHLSPLLHFTGEKRTDSLQHHLASTLLITTGSMYNPEKTSDEKWCASFYGCNIKIAEGNFNSAVTFKNSKIEKIGDISIVSNIKGITMDISRCDNLKEASVKFFHEVEHGCIIERKKVDNLLLNSQEVTTTPIETELKGKKCKILMWYNFKRAVLQNPAWAKTLKEKVSILGFIDMENSEITHLSPKLTFLGNGNGDAACFSTCYKLKKAEGIFKGKTTFDHSNIEKIGKLTILRDGYRDELVSFKHCEKLKIAKGTFYGHVNFSNSGVEKEEYLIIKNGGKPKADFTMCENLKALNPKHFHPFGYKVEPTKLDLLQKGHLEEVRKKLKRIKNIN